MKEAINISFTDILCIAPAVFLFLGSLIPITAKLINGNREPHPVLTYVFGLVGVVFSMGASFLLYPKLTSNYAFSNALVFDGSSVLATTLVGLITICTATMARESLATSGKQFSEFMFLLLNAAAGMLLLAWSNDLIVMFIAIEIMSLCLYLMVALSNEQKLSKEAAFKYFVLGGVASAIFLYGVAFIYGLAGTTYLHEIVEVAPKLISENYLFVIGLIMAAIGLCFKVSIAPFHAWAPDVYEGAPTPVTAFMSTGVKVVTFVAFLRFIRLDFLTNELTANVLLIFQWLAVLTMVVGNTAALLQDNLKRMLAYSSIAHSGYIFMGIISAGIGGDSDRGSLGVIYYLISYTIMTIGAFTVIAALEKKEDDSILIDDIKGLAKRSPIVALVFTVFLLSLAGVPPTLGFFGKFFIFTAVIKQGLFWLAFWGAVNSAISAYFYLRPIVYMYMKEEAGVSVASQYRVTRFAGALLAILILVLGLATEPLYRHVAKVVSTFF